ncbi:hypothetical protein GCK72_020918 [Caenorhabditis remanei]|uniref:Major facilitator superfamily (MFS) profile domain-containing protein n=1 Tax=Caenorhabditis remanei TaxID=31234 RepID=A0A6A5GGK6_CAERE|nr:hypothetical protein GCK72_020918 [Caenorhabditis remanei]KAF1754358.1 hypothetical protein GCK72_020918 [Caenorhabditis remanei]
MSSSDTYETKLDAARCNFVFWNRTRIYIILMTLTCLTFIQMNTLTFSFSVICMHDVMEDSRLNSTHWFSQTTEKSIIFSGAAIDGLIGLLPSVPLISFFGFKSVLVFYGIISSLGTFMFPMAVFSGFYISLLCRILQGFGSAIIFTAVGVVPGIWAPKSEANTFMAVLSCAYQLSNIVCMPVSGILCESVLGWRSIYYLFGSLTLMIYILFWFTYSDNPEDNRFISQEELSQITCGKIEKIKEPVPYISVCKDPTVLITWLSCFGGSMGFYILSLYGPTYLREVFKFEIKATGFLTSLPFVLAAVSKLSAGRLSDKLTFLSEKARFVFFAAISQMGLAGGMAVMAFTTNRLLAQVAFNFAIVCSGMNIMGVIKCAQLRCQQHVHFTLAVISFTGYADQFLAPILVRVICPDNTSQQWSILFYFVSVLVVLCNLGFPSIAKSEAADYTKPRTQKTDKF